MLSILLPRFDTSMDTKPCLYMSLSQEDPVSHMP